MYLRYPKPQKLVGLVKNMVKQGYYVSNGLMVSWWKQLKDGDHTAEAEEMLVAREEMFQLRRKWMRDSVSGDRRGKKSGSRRGSRQGLEKHGSEGKFEGTFKKATVYGRRAHESGYANWRKKVRVVRRRFFSPKGSKGKVYIA